MQTFSSIIWAEQTFICLLVPGKTSLGFVHDIILIWAKTEEELVDFLNDLNTKHLSIKLDFTYSKEKIEILDTLLYKCKNGYLQNKEYLPTKGTNVTVLERKLRKPQEKKGESPK